MTAHVDGAAPLGRAARRWCTLLISACAAVVLSSSGAAAQQAPAPVGLGTADNFAVLAGQGVTNTGPTTVNGDLGTWPNPAVTGAGLTVNGTIHAADAVARQAQADTTIAYDDAAGRTPVTTVATELGNQTLKAGVYNSATGTFGITGTLTLDAEGDPTAVFVLQAASTLITASNSNVNLINGASPCNVFWQVGSSATLGTGSTFRGTILALASITVTTGVTVEGRVLARNGAVTLDTATITRATCAPPETTGTTVTSSVNPSDTGEPVTFTATVTAPSGGTPAGSVTFLDDGTPIGTVVLDDQGRAQLTTPALPPGSHTITAVYLGAPGFTSSTSADLTQVVNQVTTTTTARPATTTTIGPATTTTTTRAVGLTATSGGSSATRTPAGTLPATGRDLREPLAVGVLFVLLGGTLIMAARTPRRGAHLDRW